MPKTFCLLPLIFNECKKTAFSILRKIQKSSSYFFVKFQKMILASGGKFFKFFLNFLKDLDGAPALRAGALLDLKGVSKSARKRNLGALAPIKRIKKCVLSPFFCFFWLIHHLKSKNLKKLLKRRQTNWLKPFQIGNIYAPHILTK